MTEYFFIIPVLTGWIMFILAIMQYFFHRKHGLCSKKLKILFIIAFITWVLALGAWTFFRNC